MSEQEAANGQDEQLVTVKMNFGRAYHYRGFLYLRYADDRRTERKYRVPEWLWRELSQLKTKQGVPYFSVATDEPNELPAPRREYVPEVVGAGHPAQVEGPTRPAHVAPQGYAPDPQAGPRPGAPTADADREPGKGVRIRPARRNQAKEIEGMDEGVEV